MNKLYAILFAIVVIFGVALAIYLYISLVPYFKIVGWIALVAVIILVLCALYFCVAFTISKTSIMWSEKRIAYNKRDLIIVNDYVVWKLTNGNYVHISAEHEKAKVQAMLPQVIDQDTPDEIEAYKDYTAEDIVKMHHNGKTEREIAAIVKMSKTSVHNVIKQYS